MATFAYPGCHFATFPPKLIEPCVLAGTSAEGCCSLCGKPWERVVEREAYTPEIVEDGARNVDDSRGDKTRKLSGADYNKQVSSVTTGWDLACSCPATKPAPCTILDPFAGSGTTGETALKYGRRFIGIELSTEYMSLMKRRITKALEADALFRMEM
ncbi:MAG: hypothetical protein GY906_38995 [bacterium]|nr:hypothetical protein [bacterium]